MNINWGFPEIDFIDVKMPILKNLKIQWVEFLGGSSYDRIIDIAISKDGDLVFASGLTDSKDFDGHRVQIDSGNSQSFSARFSKYGNKSWSLVHDKNSTVSSLDTGSDGSFYVSYTDMGSALLSKYSTKGSKKWTIKVGDSSSGGGVSVLSGGKDSIFFVGEGC